MAETQDVAAEIRELLPQSKTVEIGGEKIVLQPFMFHQIPAIFPKMAALLALVEDGAAAVLLAGPELLRDLRELFALASGKPVEWFEQLDAQAGIELTTAVAELNEGFFQAVLVSLPRLMAVMGRLEKHVPAGAKSRPT